MNSTLWIEGGVIGCKGAILPRLSFHVSATHLTVFTERFAELSSLAGQLHADKSSAHRRLQHCTNSIRVAARISG